MSFSGKDNLKGDPMKYLLFFSSLIWIFLCGVAGAVVTKIVTHQLPFVVDFLIYATLVLTCVIALAVAYYSGLAIWHSRKI
jgi:CHASE2 domain-containing sensor protein